MIQMFLGLKLFRWLAAALAAILAVAGVHWQGRRAGRKEQARDAHVEDLEYARDISRRVQIIERNRDEVSKLSDADLDDRLHELRDEAKRDD
ncbi:hypothetical protein [Halovulum sp. GXIMD14793]